MNKCRRGEGVVGRLLGKKIIAIIFVKFTQISWQYVCIFFFLILIWNTCIFVWPTMPVCHIYCVVSTPSLGMLLSKLSNRNTHVCTSSISVNCSQVAIFQIMPALCPHGQGEGGWSTKCGQAWTGREGSQKFPNLCRHPLWMTPFSFPLHFLQTANINMSFQSLRYFASLSRHRSDILC